MKKERANAMLQNAMEMKKIKMNPDKLDIKFINASIHGRTWKTKRLLIEGADINSKDARGRTGLMYATYNGYIKIVKLFVKNDNLEINMKDENGRSSLKFAEWNGYSEIAEILKAYGAE
ncbi:ankyrin repeat domain-containing protein [Candidatus Pacearchaeota archaeon]|nr:ankyrin repeat domain-containing protein [Candidatus Pacearchaeota archaeon]